MQYKKVQKSSWNEPYSSSFTKQSCSKMALYRWIKTESRWNKKLISLSSPDWSASLRPSFERKTRLLLLLLLLTAPYAWMRFVCSVSLRRSKTPVDDDIDQNNGRVSQTFPRSGTGAKWQHTTHSAPLLHTQSCWPHPVQSSSNRLVLAESTIHWSSVQLAPSIEVKETGVSLGRRSL